MNTLTNSINQATATFGTAAQTKKQIREAWKYQTCLDEAAHQRAIENWNRENAYNEQMYLKYQTPEAQRRMLEEAGYNPEILAGSDPEVLPSVRRYHYYRILSGSHDVYASLGFP